MRPKKNILPPMPVKTSRARRKTAAPSPPAPPNISALSRKHGVSRETIRKLRTDGIDLSDTAALTAALAVSKAVTTEDGADRSLASIKRRKLELECERIEAAIRRESVGYIRTERCSDILRAFAAVTKALLNGIAGNLPGTLEGATPAQVHKALEEAHYNLLSTLSNMELCENHPEMKRCMAEMERLDRKNLCHECRKLKDEDHED